MMKIAVLMGGISRERKISLISGENVLKALKKLGHNVTKVDVTEDFPSRLESLRDFDLIFNVLHGVFGEDGRIQAMLDWIGVRYTGSGVLASSICFNKIATYRVVSSDVKYPDFVPIKEPTDKSPFGFPCVIKPVSEGSSIGVHICDTEKDLMKYSTLELNNYNELILQRYVPGRELTVSILEQNEGPTALPVLELKPKRRFYDYTAKYTPNMTQFIVPAPLTPEEEEQVVESSLKAFKLCHCHGFARVDGILSNGTFHMLEINTIPGLTDLSDMPASALAAGMSFEQLIECIVSSAVS